jgi:hypothetical protein
MSRISGSTPSVRPPPSPEKVRWRLFAPCEESDSRWVPFSKVRGLERATTACSPSSSSILCLRLASAVFADLLPLGMSVQPDIPICVSALPPLSANARTLFRSCRDQTSACSFLISRRGC